MFDVLTVAAITDELAHSIVDGRIQKLGLVDSLTIAIEVYAHGRRRALIATAESTNPRIHLVDRYPSTDPSLITPFGLQLRKYVRGGILVGVEQPPMERIVRLSIAKRLEPYNEAQETIELDDDIGDDAADEHAWMDGMTRVDVIVEIMGRHSNMLLVDEAGSIMESAKRVTSRQSRVRPILPRLPYVPPPVLDRPDPRRLTSASAEVLMAAAEPDRRLKDVLVRGLRGVSPQIAAEITFGLTGDVTSVAGAVAADHHGELARLVRNAFEPLLTRVWQPLVYERDGELVEYSSVARGHLAALDSRETSSMSAAVAALAVESIDGGPQDHRQRRMRIVAAVERECDRVRQRLNSMQIQFERVANAEKLRTWGETIFAYIWQIRPGDVVLQVDGMEVPLDPALSAKDNAQAYFEEYRKVQRAGSQLPEQIAAAAIELEYLEQVRMQAEQAEGFAAVETIRQEFEQHTGGRQETGERAGARARKQLVRRVPPLTDADGNLIYIGKSGSENDQVAFSIAGPEDTWLHARGVPGSHVILRAVRPTDTENEGAIETAAALAAHYSRSRSAGSVEVDVTLRKYVRKIKGAGPGMVTYRNERTIAVRPQDEATLRAEGRLA